MTTDYWSCESLLDFESSIQVEPLSTETGEHVACDTLSFLTEVTLLTSVPNCIYYLTLTITLQAISPEDREAWCARVNQHLPDHIRVLGEPTPNPNPNLDPIRTLP